jgi:hypothetical protein
LSIPVQEFDVGEQWKARLHDAHDKNVNVDGQRKSSLHDAWKEDYGSDVTLRRKGSSTTAGLSSAG